MLKDEQFYVRYQIDVLVSNQEDVELEADSLIGARSALDSGEFTTHLVNSDGEEVKEIPNGN